MNKWIIIALVGAAGLLYWFVWRKKPSATVTTDAPVDEEEEAAPSIGGGGGFWSAGDTTNPGIALGPPVVVPVSVAPAVLMPSIPNTQIFLNRYQTAPVTNPGVGGGISQAPINPNVSPSNITVSNPRWGYLQGTQSPLNPQL